MENLFNENLQDDSIKNESVKSKEVSKKNDEDVNNKIKNSISGKPSIMSDAINKVFKNDDHVKSLEQENNKNINKNNVDKENQPDKDVISSKEKMNSSLKENLNDEVNKKFDHYKKRLDENTKYNSLLLGNRSKAISLIKEYGENGDLSEEQVNSLVNTLKAKDLNAEDEKDSSEYNYVLPEFKNFHRLITPDLEEQYKEFMNESDNEYNNKIKAYGAYLQELSQEEKEEFLERLDELKSKPLMMLKEIMNVGTNYLTEGFGDILEHGGVRKYLSYMQKQLSKSKKTIDELNEKLAKLKPNYDKPTYDFEELYEPLEEVKKEDNNSNTSSKGLMNAIVKEVSNKPVMRNFR